MNNADKQFITRKVKLLCHKYTHTLKVNNLMGFTAFKKKVRVLFSLEEPYYPCFIAPNGEYIVADTAGTLEFFLFTNYDEHVLRIFTAEEYHVDGGDRIKFQKSLSPPARLAHFNSSLQKGLLKVHPDIFSATPAVTEPRPQYGTSNPDFDSDGDESPNNYSYTEGSPAIRRVSYDILDLDDEGYAAPVNTYTEQFSGPRSENSSSDNQSSQKKEVNPGIRDMLCVADIGNNSLDSTGPTNHSPAFRSGGNPVKKETNYPESITSGFKVTEPSVKQENFSFRDARSTSSNYATEESQPRSTKLDEIRRLCQEFDEVLKLSSTSSILELLVDQELNGVDIKLDVLRKGLQRRMFSLTPLATGPGSSAQGNGNFNTHASLQLVTDPSNAIYQPSLGKGPFSQELVPFSESSAWEVLPSAFKSFSIDAPSEFSNAGFSKLGH